MCIKYERPTIKDEAQPLENYDNFLTMPFNIIIWKTIMPYGEIHHQLLTNYII